MLPSNSGGRIGASGLSTRPSRTHIVREQGVSSTPCADAPHAKKDYTRSRDCLKEAVPASLPRRRIGPRCHFTVYDQVHCTVRSRFALLAARDVDLCREGFARLYGEMGVLSSE